MPSESWSIPYVHLMRSCDQWLLTGDETMIRSYLDRFGVIPAMDPGTCERKLVRPGKQGKWIVEDCSENTVFDLPARDITDKREQLDVLTSHSWHSINYTVTRISIKFDFSPDGKGTSRFLEWGFDWALPKVIDAVWEYNLSGPELIITWQDKKIDKIGFALRHELKVVGSLGEGGLEFFETTLSVSQHLFPSNSRFFSSWSKEYWGRARSACKS